MAAGDKEQAVTECVNGALAARGYPPPYDRTQAMNGRYRYQFETMIAFHRRVKACLATKGYSYGYPESQGYINDTLVMTLRQIYAAVATRSGTSVHFTMDALEQVAAPDVPTGSARRTRAGRSRVTKSRKKSAKRRQEKER